VDIYPLTRTDPALSSACVISADVVTVDDMSTPSTYARKLITERALQEREDIRPRILNRVEAAAQQTDMPAVLAGVIPMPPHTRSVTKPDATTFAVIDKGRVALRDAVRLFGWNTSTALSFTVTGSTITVTACVAEAEEGTVLDKQQRCGVPMHVRMRTELKDGEIVLVRTSRTPVEHVRINAENYLHDALTMKEQEL